MALAGLALVSCVTETVDRPSRGVTVKPNPKGSSSNQPGGPTRTNEPTPLPTGPVASPVLGSSTNSRIQVSILPLGTIEYDGQVLPVVSPSGGFVAVQEGDPPSWPTLLAERDSFAPIGTRIAIYSIGEKGLTRVPLVERLSGFVLGRAADDRGFLVENPRPDGTRWIGRVSWAGGQVQWLVQGNAVNSHAVLLTPDELVYCRKMPGTDHASLVLRGVDGAEVVRDDAGGSYAMPISTGDPSIIHALFRGPNGLEIEAIRVSRSGESGALSGPRFGATLARRTIVSNTEAAMAFQIAVPVQSIAGPAPDSAGAANPEPGTPLSFFHPGSMMQRMVVFDLNSGAFLPLPGKSVSATWYSPRISASGAAGGVAGEPGFFCTTPEGLYFALPPKSPSPDQNAQRAAPVLASPYVSRATRDAVRSLILFGPRRNDPKHLEVLALMVAPPVAEER